MIRQRPFPFHTLGYQRNPFGSLTNEEWTAVAIPPPVLREAWAQKPSVLQLLGEKGSGKTSSLFWLLAQLEAEGVLAAYEHLPEEARRFTTDLTGLDGFVLDEAQRLSWREKWRLLRQRPSRLILSSHQDLTRLFRRRGVTLASVDLDGAATLAQVTAVLQRRLDYFALDGRPRLTLSDDAIRFLHDQFSPDLRAMEFLLYEVWQEQTEPEVLTAVDLTNFQQTMAWRTAVTQTAPPLSGLWPRRHPPAPQSAKPH